VSNQAVFEPEKALESSDITPCLISDNTSPSNKYGKYFRFSSRGDRRFAFPNDMGSLRLFWLTIAQTVSITADAIYNRPKSK